MDTNAIIQQIFEGVSPRDAISEAAGTITKKEVHNGKVVKRKHLKKKKHRILTGAQRKAIKKAQRAAQKADANKKRVKSLRKRAKVMGEGEEAPEEILSLPVTCPSCGSVTGLQILEPEEEGDGEILVCPDCGEELVIVPAAEAYAADEDDFEDEDFEDAEDDTDEDAETGDDEEGTEDTATDDEGDSEELYFDDEDDTEDTGEDE